LSLGVPAVLVRRVPKTYFVSYGDDPAIGGGRLAGERLPPGTPIRLIDDLVFSGQTLRSAREALSLAGLDATTASAIVWTYRADAAMEELAAAGITEITCLTHQSLISEECRLLAAAAAALTLASARLERRRPSGRLRLSGGAAVVGNELVGEGAAVGVDVVAARGERMHHGGVGRHWQRGEGQRVRACSEGCSESHGKCASSAGQGRQ
jgi:hypothetical protein